ncbi:CD209 antigen-like protein E isoform X1 [Puntigrus tetrazona]|uniref:CD209 antigen-like protein E isoform X1 n=1 Tax=Puntigrus tetrazona TaxID=1606681 RepID=UPI001C89FF9F|nr:CD209 antigen-like protein E isoform X1 [Puntigrus tetrazona]
MSDAIYDDVTRVEAMKRERVEMTVDIYESADSVRDHDFTTKTNTLQPLQGTGRDSVGIRIYKAAVICLVLLCVLLLTAVVLLFVHIDTNNTKYTEKTNQLLTTITNLTEENNVLIYKLSIFDERIYCNSFYYMSNETKNWNDSRRDCKKRGADLIIINNKEENDFVMKITNKTAFWIGLTDIEEEDTWKWVDGSELTSGFWASGQDVEEPKGGKDENCAVTYLTHNPELTGWHDVKCETAYQWICEKSILPFIQP